jgi:hypothetical protein
VFIAFRFVALLIVLLALAACAGDRTLHRVGITEQDGAPTQLQLARSRSLGTLHFPAGTYVRYAADRTGWYYQAPRKIIQHSWGGSVGYSGGLFIDRRDPNKTRGYIVWDAGLTKVGTVPEVIASSPIPVAQPVAPAEGPPVQY